jgi:anaerobic magnesium-protoporphyrin IX monomethyl ester cyclase
MHILLVVPRYSSTWGEFYQFPLGLGYIAAAMKRGGHTVTGLNLNHHQGSIESIVSAKIAAISPDVCATGALSPFLPLVQSIFNAARQAKPTIINIAGGGVVSGEPGVILDVADIDVGVVGEGELTIVELLDCLGKSGDLHAVQGIVFRDKNGKTVQTPERPQIMDLGKLAWPDYEVLECEQNVSGQRALDSYFFHSQRESKPRAIDMITSRSCPFKCTFCFHPTGKTYRERPLDDFFAELDTLVARYKINMVGLIDELFSLKKTRLLEFCERIKPYNLQWMVQLHVNSATEETVRAMRESGCAYISYGIESMSQPVLESMLKKSKTHRIDSSLDLTYKYRIGIQGNLLFGDSAETLETANESMHWWAANRRYQINLTPLMVFPGSPDYLAALRDGLIDERDRAKYIQDIPAEFNISRMNDKNMEMIRFQVWVFANTLLNIAPLKSFQPSAEQIENRDTAYDIVWDCPNCNHQNDYLGVVLPPDTGHSIRLTCRECNTRWDVKNAVHKLAPNTINDATCAAHFRQAEAFFEQEKFKECHDIANELLGLAPNFIPARLLMGKFYRRVGPSEHMVKSFGAALGATPFDPERHNDFAEALQEIGAHGAARMHYEQALALQPDNKRAMAGIAFIDSTQVSEQQRTSYFISWSEDTPPQRRSGVQSCQSQASIEEESIAPIAGVSKGAQTSVLKRLSRWIRPE